MQDFTILRVRLRTFSRGTLVVNSMYLDSGSLWSLPSARTRLFAKVEENAPLSQEDYEFMSRFDAMMAGIGHNADVDVRLAAGTSEDPWSGQVPERTGYLDILVVAYDAPGGGVRVAAGPIFSYYEFRHAEGGLTDGEWR